MAQTEKYLTKLNYLKIKMRKIKMYDKDIKESFIVSAGPGGQNVNKVATCVQMIHQPTGVQVKCQVFRTQILNRIKARELLIQKFIHLQEKEAKQKIYLKQKWKRQNRKRSQRSKEEMLAEKKKNARKKDLRRKINMNNIDS